MTATSRVANNYFADEQKLACAKCHSIDGTASKAEPDLQSAGDKFGRSDLLDAILTPSAVIAPGYETVIVAGERWHRIHRILKQANAAGIQIMGADGKIVSVATADLKEKRGSTLSLMPEACKRV